MEGHNITFFFLLLASPALGIFLGTYNIEPNSTTTSGVGAGAVMATQFHVIHSSKVQGVGMFAGAPYGCALGLASQAVDCMLLPKTVVMLNLYSRTNYHERLNRVDPTSNLRRGRVFIYQGQEDTVVRPASADNVKAFYHHYGMSSIHEKTDLAAQHGMPSIRDGGPCGEINEPVHINNCGYDGAFEMLNHLYGGGLRRPTGGEAVRVNLQEFNQTEFFVTGEPELYSMERVGYVYIPTACANGAPCKLHVAFHGCGQGRVAVGIEYTMKSGYLEAAEINNIIVLMPQVRDNLANPQGCWDWWGYISDAYDTRNGAQIVLVNRMINRMTSSEFY